eukprot:12917268-Prorocentrum_lima.AAC.1
MGPAMQHHGLRDLASLSTCFFSAVLTWYACPWINKGCGSRHHFLSKLKGRLYNGSASLRPAT